MKKIYIRLLVAAGLVFAYSVGAHASISVSSPLHNTGDSGALLGAVDTDYTTAGAGADGKAYVSSVYTTWAPNTGSAQWISINPKSKSPTSGGAFVDITYETTFKLTGGVGDSAKITISGEWAADGFIDKVWVNGNLILGVGLASPGWSAPLQSFSFSENVGTLGSILTFDDGSNPLAATNTITINVRDGGNVTGLIIDNFTAVSADLAPVPEPASLAIWALLGSVIGIGILRRKRNA